MDRLMLRSSFKRKAILFIFLTPLLINISIRADKSSYKDLLVDSRVVETINIKNLMTNLLEADKKLIPIKIINPDGTYFFRYKKRIAEDDLSLEEIEKRILLGSDFFKNDRNNVRILMKKIQDLKIKSKFESIDSGALGLWIPKKDLIIIDYRVIKMGSKIFLEILRHEAIHVAQSCFSNSRNEFPIRIGLPLEFSTDINFNLSHKIYSKDSEEVLNIEREAFTYSKIDGAAIKLLNKYCK